MVNLKKQVTSVSIMNLTGKTMRDIILTYDGDNNPIEILRIKDDYEKIVFLHTEENEDLFNLNLVYNGKKYIVYKNIDINSDVNIKLMILTAENEEIEIKSYLFIK